MRVLLLMLALAAGARAEEPPSPSPRAINLRGRVVVRGSINPISGATLTAESGEGVAADGDGRFALALPDGESQLLVSAPGFASLKVRERIRPGEGRNVEYRLLPENHSRYQSRVLGPSRHEGERFQLQGEEMRTLPGTLGDPFRAVGLLPGVTTPVPLLPVYVVRGDSPGTNGFFLDGMRVPQLFHVLVGGGVVNGRLVDRLDFYPGSYDASFGHFAGGIIDSETRAARRDGQHGEVQLRLYDLTAEAELALPHEVGLTVSGTYGWPGALVQLFAPGTDVQYGDYQLRLDWKGLTVQAIGSYDSLSQQAKASDGSLFNNEFRLSFHRLQLRWRGRHGRVSYEVALVGGYDRAIAFGGNGVDKLGLGWRAVVSARWSRVRFDAGLDGEVSRFGGFNTVTPSAGIDSLGELAQTRNGVVAGAYLLLSADLVPGRLTATLSGRADVYSAGGVTLIGLDPRFTLRAHLHRRLALIAGGGVYHQPPSFPVPLPGIDTFALELGLQTSYHSSLGLEAALPADFAVSLTGYYQRYSNVIDSTLDATNVTACNGAPPEQLRGIPAQIMRQDDGQSYGAELLVRRSKGVVTGWLAYTIGRSERFLPCGARPSDFDQTHTLNLAVQARLPRQVMLGARLYLATGRPATKVDPALGYQTPRNNFRLPTFVQLDLRLDREWIFRNWAFDGFVEIVNLTYSESAFGVEYPNDLATGMQRLDQPQVSGIRWILPSLGVRGRF